MAETDEAKIAKQIRTFGENLRSARQHVGLTQVELSAATPLDRAAISRLECGQRAPDLTTVLRLCAAVRVTPVDLLHGIGPKSSRRLARDADAKSSSPAATFGANLRWAREQTAISQECLALEAKVDRAAISVYENGGREPNLRTVLKLAMKLEVPPASLLHDIA